MNRLPVFRSDCKCKFYECIYKANTRSINVARYKWGPRPVLKILKPFSSNRTTGHINSRLKWTPYARLLRLLRYISHRVKFTPLFRRETYIHLMLLTRWNLLWSGVKKRRNDRYVWGGWKHFSKSNLSVFMSDVVGDDETIKIWFCSLLRRTKNARSRIPLYRLCGTPLDRWGRP